MNTPTSGTFEAETPRNIDYLETKARSELSYSERHALSHLRHVRDKELSRMAWKNCKPYQKIYGECLTREGIMSPFRCQDELEDMRVCVNRACVRIHESTTKLQDLPPGKPSDFS